MSRPTPEPPLTDGIPTTRTASEERAAAKLAGDAGAAKLHAILTQRLSPARLGAFEELGAQADNSPPRVLARYWYSIALAETLVSPLHLLEVTLRNAVYEAVAGKYAGGDGVDIAGCWLDYPAERTLLCQEAGASGASDFTKVLAAKRAISRDRRPLDAGRLIAELNLGFWIGLFAGHYGERPSDDPQTFWPDLLPVVFPNLPATERSRSTVATRLTELRRIRNRAFHHEPLWRNKPTVVVDKICDVLAWMDMEVTELARAMSNAKRLQEFGLAGYEAKVRQFALRQFPPVAPVVPVRHPGAPHSFGGLA